MKTITFNDRLYAVKDYMDLSGGDYDQIAACIERLKAGPPAAYNDVVVELLGVLTPDVLEEVRGWPKQIRFAFFGAIFFVPLEMLPYRAVLHRLKKSVRRPCPIEV